jgi:hypothetical protein
MDTIRVTYEHDEGTWMAESTDFRLLDGSVLCAGGSSYEAARQQVTGVIPWALEREDIVIEHFVHEDSLPALAAERQRAATAIATAAAVAKR